MLASDRYTLPRNNPAAFTAQNNRFEQNEPKSVAKQSSLGCALL
jgi:hypothetical protein